MHRLTFALALALALPSLAPAQQPFASIGSTWTYTQGSCCGPDTNIAVITVPGDTLIDGRTYSKLVTTSGWFVCHTLPPFIRNANDSMFYRDEGATEEHLLFRWNAVPGDTWSTPIAQSGILDTLDWTVADTGHVTIDGTVLRTVTVNQTSRQFMLFAEVDGPVTERLGPGGGPFTWAYGACDAETFLNTRCFSDTDLDWLNPLFPGCSLISGVPDLAPDDTFAIHPSLVEHGNSVHVATGPGAAGNCTLTVRDAAGRLLRTMLITGESADVRMDREGVMLLTLETHDGLRITRRVMVR